MVRAFLALELSGEIREGLKGAQDLLRTAGARMTYVKPENIHITVKFLGEVDERLLLRVIDAIRTLSFAPFEVSIGNVTVNNPRRPFTVWSTVSDGGRSAELFSRVEEAFAPLGFAKETRPFTPHATLARIKAPPGPAFFTVLDSLKNRSYGSCKVTGIKLKKSSLTPGGPVYEDLLEVSW
jgi:2'-5' RNA ligase